MAFSQSTPTLLRRARYGAVHKCARRRVVRASAAASPPAAVPESNAVASSGALAVEPANDVALNSNNGVAFSGVEVRTIEDVDAIVQLADEFDLADLRIESNDVTVEITREGGLGFEDGVLNKLPPPPQQEQLAQQPGAEMPMGQTEAHADNVQQDVLQAVESERNVVEKKTKEEAEVAADPDVVYDSDFVVKSNRVGFFFSGARNKPPLVNVGDHVAFNQPVCIIEQLGQQYVYLSEVSGTVTQIFVEDGDAVQYDDQVMVIRPD